MGDFDLEDVLLLDRERLAVETSTLVLAFLFIRAGFDSGADGNRAATAASCARSLIS